MTPRLFSRSSLIAARAPEGLQMTCRRPVRWSPSAASALALALWFAAPQVEAQAVDIGGQFTVNESTTVCAQQARVDTALDGRFVVVWSNSDSQTVLFRRYDADGAPAGGQQVVVDTGTGQDPDVGVAGDGRFVVLWTKLNSIAGRLYDSAGQPVGADFTVAGAPGIPTDPRVAMDDTGAFVVTWRGLDTAGEASIKARRYDAAGQPLGAVLDVDTTTGVDVVRPAVGLEPTGGRFVVAWTEFPGSGTDIKARRFDATGTAAGGEFRVNSDPAGFQLGHDVAVEGDGGFVVVWHGTVTGSNLPGVYESVYLADGSPLRESRLGVETRSESFPAVALSNDGDGRATVFQIGTPDDTSLRLTAQQQVDLPLVSSLSNAIGKDLAIDDRERAVVVWRDESEDACASVSAKRMQTYRIFPDETVQAKVHSTDRQAAWKYYVYFPTEPALVTIQLQPPAGKDLDLYVQSGDFPNLTNYDCRPFQGAGSPETCSFFSSGAPLLIGVNGWDQLTLDFTLEATETPMLFGDGFESGDTSAWDALVQ
ncbi:MAG: hypothetical protein AAGM22_16470 [Acidobacteriota bacterium]